MMTCKKCGGEMKFSGFVRNLIRRGKNKGAYNVNLFYTCPVCKGKKDEN
jgi:hypothetical protein